MPPAREGVEGGKSASQSKRNPRQKAATSKAPLPTVDAKGPGEASMAKPAVATNAKTQVVGKPQARADPEGFKLMDGIPPGKKFRDGYWNGGLKMFKPNGRGMYQYFNGDR